MKKKLQFITKRIFTGNKLFGLNYDHNIDKRIRVHEQFTLQLGISGFDCRLHLTNWFIETSLYTRQQCKLEDHKQIDNLTNRLQFSMCVYCNRSQMTSQRVKSKKEYNKILLIPFLKKNPTFIRVVFNIAISATRNDLSRLKMPRGHFR